DVDARRGDVRSLGTRVDADARRTHARPIRPDFHFHPRRAHVHTRRLRVFGTADQPQADEDHPTQSSCHHVLLGNALALANPPCENPRFPRLARLASALLRWHSGIRGSPPILGLERSTLGLFTATTADPLFSPFERGDRFSPT